MTGEIKYLFSKGWTFTAKVSLPSGLCLSTAPGCRGVFIPQRCWTADLFIELQLCWQEFQTYGPRHWPSLPSSVSNPGGDASPTNSTLKQDSRCQGTAYSVSLSNSSVITVSYWCGTGFGSELSMVSLFFLFPSKLTFFIIIANKWKHLSGNGTAAWGLLIAAFHLRKSRGKEAKVSKLTGQDTVFVCTYVRVCFFKLPKQNNKKIETAIPVITLPRLRVELPFPLLAVIPSKTPTEGHKAFY